MLKSVCLLLLQDNSGLILMEGPQTIQIISIW